MIQYSLRLKCALFAQLLFQNGEICLLSLSDWTGWLSDTEPSFWVEERAISAPRTVPLPVPEPVSVAVQNVRREYWQATFFSACLSLPMRNGVSLGARVSSRLRAVFAKRQEMPFSAFAVLSVFAAGLRYNNITSGSANNLSWVAFYRGRVLSHPSGSMRLFRHSTSVVCRPLVTSNTTSSSAKNFVL
ncbi:hypothetical protein BO70DRAFT_397277 [Aspergillus heteromorphus CBS 117.55]|uniref:Uncharacterized protein n=1 Tax=Aspergillus heteromorphus CBS 117.55 TaxID=1448321 RepID=A0A317W0M0_9EURO|nr:uncharacterized protein BO70DRAFT_397277 [Aspergillus heteromorphus CBS 117.55]PWY79161.1 hypothetical protein BO70DRAFT_397277 [Aspergillus heteromorphus CBS 117.55]